MVFWFGQSKQTNATESTEQENHESSSSAVSASTTGVGAATTGVANGLFVDESINPMPTNAAPLSNTPNNELSNAPSASTSASASSASATTELTSTTVTTEQTTSTVNPSTTKPPLLSINSVNSSTVNNTTETSSSATATSTDASLSTTTAAVVAKPAPDDSTPFCNAKSNPKKETGWGADALNHDHVKKGYIRLSTDGKSFMCVLCASTIKTRHDYAFSRMSGSGGHEFSDKHRRNVQARELSERHAAKRKAEGKPVQSSVLKKQKSLFGLSNFSLTSKKRQKTSETQATTTSTSNSEVANSNGGDEGGKNVSHGESTQFQPDAAGDVDVDLSKAACVPPRDNRNSNNCTGIIPIKRLTTSTPNAPRLEVGTFVRYAAIASDNYGPRYVGENTDMINLFHNNCIGHAIIQTGKRNGGLRCSNCRDYWKKNSSKIAELIRRRASKFSDVLECLLKPSLTDEDAKSMEKFCRTPQDSLSSTGKDLMRQVEDRRNFYNTVCKIPACTEECGSSLAPAAGTLTVVKNAEPFLFSFVELYKENKDMRDSLIMGLLYVMVEKVKGNRNPRLPEIALNFFIAVDATSRSAFDLISAQFVGPCLRTIQRNNAKKDRPLLICTDESVLIQRLIKHIEEATQGRRRIGIALCFDGTKVPPVLTLSTSHNVILGGVVPNHCIDVSGMSADEVKSILAPGSDIQRAKEIKVGVISITNHVAGRNNPCFAFAAQTQTINMPSDFNERMTNLVDRICNQRNDASLVAVATDGASCEKKFIRGRLTSFLRGDINHCGLIDPNHNAKNFRYMMVGGSCVLMIGNFIMDPQLLVLAGVPVELWRVKDWASDNLVLKLASSTTVESLVTLHEEEDASIAVLCMTLYFTRLKLFAVNAKKADSRDRISFLWASMLWLTSITSRSRLTTNQANMAQNRANIITESIALVFVMARNDVTNPRLATEEPAEHFFANWRNQKREATVQELMDIEIKRRNKMDAIFASNLKVSRDPKKGYGSSFDAFVESNVPEGATGGKVDINNNNAAAVDLLWDEVYPIINGVSNRMKELLMRFGVDNEGISPFCRQFESVAELLSTYIAHGPKDNEDSEDNEDVATAAPENNDNDGDNVNIDNLASFVAAATTTTMNDDDDDNDNDNDGGGNAAAGVGDNEQPNLVDLAEEEFGDDATSPMAKFRNVLQSKGMSDMIIALREAICVLHLRNSERGAISSDRKYNSLSGRWFVKDNNGGLVNTPSTSSSSNGAQKFIERNVHVKLPVQDGNNVMSNKDFRVLGIYTKTYNKWFPCQKGRQPWHQNQAEGKYRIYARMIEFDHSLGAYQDTDPANSNWGVKSIYVLCDASYIAEVLGKITLST